MVATNAELMGETLRDIAEAIREKRGIYYDIDMLDFAAEIRLIQSPNETIFIHIPYQETGQNSDAEISVINVGVNPVTIPETIPAAVLPVEITVS